MLRTTTVDTAILHFKRSPKVFKNGFLYALKQNPAVPHRFQNSKAAKLWRIVKGD